MLFFSTHSLKSVTFDHYIQTVNPIIFPGLSLSEYVFPRESYCTVGVKVPLKGDTFHYEPPAVCPLQCLYVPIVLCDEYSKLIRPKLPFGIWMSLSKDFVSSLPMT